MARNIVITGFMGTGKSSVGRRLARALGFRFLDTDELIENETGLKISDIFQRYGEAHFRRLEKDIIQRLTSGRFGRGIVLSTGGGAVVDDTNRRLLRGWGTVVCLTASVDTILKRVEGSDERPLLEESDRRRKIEELLREREEAYRDSDLMIDTSSKTVDEVVEEIRRFLLRKG